MVDDEQLTDEVLRELGHLVWAAILLEDVIYPVCRSIRPRGGAHDDIPIGQRIHFARQDLKARPRDDLRVRADAWLIRAKDALKERNNVMHVAPIALVLSGAEKSEVGGLDASAPSRTRPRPTTRTSLTVEDLRPIRNRLERAREGWGDLAAALWERRDETDR
jgi:hypothetical protein